MGARHRATKYRSSRDASEPPAGANPASFLKSPPTITSDRARPDGSGDDRGTSDDLTRRVVSGVGWVAVGRGMGQLGAFILSAVLARLLTPKDFGLIAISTVFTGFASLFVEMGFGAALVQARSLQETHRSSVFWLNLCAGLLLAGLTIALAPTAATFFDEPRLGGVLSVLSLTFVIGSLSMVQRAVLSRLMRFRLLATIDVIGVWVSGGFALAAALAGFGVWSLVIQSITSVTCAALLLWVYGQWKPTVHFRLESVKELLSFSSNLLGFSVLNYWVRNLDNLLIGKFFGPGPLGLYSRAYSLMLLPTSQIANVLGSVMFPALSRIQDDTARVKRAYLRSISLIAFITFPLLLGLAAAAENFVRTIYGEQWLQVAGLLQILCVVGALQSVGSTVGWLYRSQGRTDALLRWGIGAGAFLLSSIGLGIWLGSVEAVATCYAIASCLLFYPNVSIPGRYIGLRMSDVFRALWRPATCSVAMALLVALLGRTLDDWSASWVRLVVQGCFGCGVYIGLAWFVNPGAFKELFALIGRRSGAALNK